MSDLEAEIKHIETLEARRAEQIRILKSVQIQDAALRREIKSRKAALRTRLINILGRCLRTATSCWIGQTST